MNYTGEIQITEELRLLNPSLVIKRVSYDWELNTVDIEALFKEPNSIINHSRSFTFNNETGAELTIADINNFVSNHEILGQFN